MSRQVRISLALVVVFAAVIVGVIALGGDDDESAAQPAPATPTAQPAGEAEQPRVVREDLRILGTRGDSGVVFTEFLDFECEACRAAYPLIEQLREEYEGRVTFAYRYFPIPSHANAVNSALAVEAAARQGRQEAMYQRMYETQASWGEQQDSKAALFRSFAADLGLDMAAYDRDVASADVEARVMRDYEEGAALGVQGTPTFFLDEELFEPMSEEDLRASIDAAIESAGVSAD